VQPVLDRYCISCHGLKRKAGKVSLLGTPAGDFNEAYLSLTKDATDRRRQRKGNLLVVIAQRNMETYESAPGDYGARAGRLAAMLAGKHRKFAPLDEASYSRIVSWLDLNGQYYGNYRGSEGQVRKLNAKAMARLREHIAGVFNDELAKQPEFALVNPVDPLQSRILLAPLAKEAGGWGQISPTWASRNDAGYRKMLKLVTAAAAVGE
jgi:hypothetical protein